MIKKGNYSVDVILSPSPCVTLSEAKGLAFLAQDKLREESLSKIGIKRWKEKN
ncbi:MAG: hypothetical protein AB1638_05820 [Nitrospirota bacterium]